jgi:hypothetical protein
MSIDFASQTMYQVVVTPYAQRHFIKRYEKKYKKSWLVTLDALKAQCSHIESMVWNSRIPSPIHATADNQHWILKHSFAVAGLGESPRGSGNRAILYANREEKLVHLLLVYHKTDLGDGNETTQWHSHIKESCPDLAKRFRL